MQNLKVGIIQTSLIWEDPKANMDYLAEQFLAKVEKGSVDLILLPEMFNTGFSMKTAQLSETMGGPSIKWLVKWAKALDCCIGGSLIIGENGSYYNRFVMVSQNGVLETYDKRHLFRMAKENHFFTAGTERKIIEIKGWKLMLQVCYDLRFPVFSRNNVVEGNKEYDALLYVANWPKKRAYIWKNLLQARAIENQAYTIGVNRIGIDDNEIDYSGDSMVVNPWGEIDYQAKPEALNYKLIELKREVLNNITERFPAFLDADQFDL